MLLAMSLDTHKDSFRLERTLRLVGDETYFLPEAMSPIMREEFLFTMCWGLLFDFLGEVVGSGDGDLLVL